MVHGSLAHHCPHNKSERVGCVNSGTTFRHSDSQLAVISTRPRHEWTALVHQWEPHRARGSLPPTLQLRETANLTIEFKPLSYSVCCQVHLLFIECQNKILTPFYSYLSI